MAWTRRSIDSGPSTRCERPEPGRSGRTVRWRATAGSSGVHTLDVPPSPWIIKTASPVPSVSTAIRSMNCVATNRSPGSSSRRGPAEAPARRPLLRILVEHAVLHHAEEPRAVLEHRDVGEGIAVHQQQIRQVSLPDLPELAAAHHDLAAELGRGEQ